MFQIIDRTTLSNSKRDLAEMFRQRKKVFVDSLKWQLNCHGEEEKDQYDTATASYLIWTEKGTGRQLSSCRFLPTTRPHLMSDLFSEHCQSGVPIDPKIWEISRYCINPEIRGRAANREIMGRMAAATLEFGLDAGLSHFTFYTTMLMVPHILSFGWEVEPLGLPHGVGYKRAMALIATVSEEGLAAVRQNFCIEKRLLPHAVGAAA